MVEYSRASLYVENSTSVNEKITRIDAIITALETAALDATSNDSVVQYTLDNGQTKISETYRGSEAIFSSINKFIRLREYYINKLNGRVSRCVDSKNLKGRNW